MLYCEKCLLAIMNNHCPICGSRNLRTPLPDDYCFLCEKQVMWGELLGEALRSNDIPVIFKRKIGAGMALKAGPMMERLKVYVPFSRYIDSLEIVDELFSELSEEEEEGDRGVAYSRFS